MNTFLFQLEAASEIGNVDAVQPPFNLIHRDAADDVLLWRLAGDVTNGDQCTRSAPFGMKVTALRAFP